MQVWQGGTGEGASIGRHRPISRIVMMIIIVNSRYHVCLAILVVVPSQVLEQIKKRSCVTVPPFLARNKRSSFLPLSAICCGQSQTPARREKRTVRRIQLEAWGLGEETELGR